MAAPWTVGIVADHIGFTIAMALGGITPILAAVPVFLADGKRDR